MINHPARTWTHRCRRAQEKVKSMKALIYDHRLRYVPDLPLPEPGPGQARIKVHLAGICGTDLEIVRGYQGFRGVLGHEFVGRVDSCEDPAWIGRRVVGEINAGCKACEWCSTGLERHCPHRSTLGIANQEGCMAEFCVLPTSNLHVVDQDTPDERAVFAEPLAAACEILEQISLDGSERIVVLGDGRLGILCAWALTTVGRDLTLMGRHPEKLEVARWRGVKTSLHGEGVEPGADIVVDATGSGRGIAQAMDLCRPRGVIVLKSTVALQGEVNLAPLVVNEITVVGSRCGRFRAALTMMRDFPDMPLERLITDRYPLHKGKEAFEVAGSGKSLKVLLEV